MREKGRPVNTFKTGIRLPVRRGEIFVAPPDLSTEICAVMEESWKSERNGSAMAKTLAKKGSRVCFLPAVHGVC